MQSLTEPQSDTLPANLPDAQPSPTSGDAKPTEENNPWLELSGIFADDPPEYLALWRESMREAREQRDREEAEAELARK